MNSIRRKLLVALIGAMTLVMLAGAWATYRAARAEADTIFDYHLEQIALSLRNQTFQGSTEALAGEKSFDFVIRVWDRDGLSIYYSQPHRVLPDIARLGYATEETSDGAWRVYALQFRNETIAVAQPMRVRAKLAAETALRTLVPFLVLLPLLASLIWLVVSRELRPLSELARSVRASTPVALDPLDTAGVPEEVLPLVAALNDLLARLKTAIQTQRDFIADAAHELRTPLTALQLQAQLLERAAGEAERSAAMVDLRRGLARASHTVRQLLTLARQEPGAAMPAYAPVALADVARQVVADHASLAAARGIDLGLAEADPAVRVCGDGDALAILLANLVANALRHTPAGGRVDVSCGADETGAWLAVADTGPGIPAAERERVFDRFYRRSDSERVDGVGGADGAPGDGAGSGLGLAIVRAIADRHGATIRLDEATTDPLLPGLRVRVTFPPAPLKSILSFTGASFVSSASEPLAQRS